MIIKSRKILYKDWIYTWLIEKKDYIKESTYANYSNNIFNHIITIYIIANCKYKKKEFFIYLIFENSKF